MEFEVSTIIERSATAVWDFYAVHHVQNHPRWDPDMSLEQVTSGPIGLGTVIRRRYTRFGVPHEGTMEIVEFDPLRAGREDPRRTDRDDRARETRRRRAEPYSTDDSSGHHGCGFVDGREAHAARAAELRHHQASHRIRVRARFLARARLRFSYPALARPDDHDHRQLSPVEPPNCARSRVLGCPVACATQAEDHDPHGGTFRRFVSLAVVIALLGGGCAEGGDEPSPASTRDSSGTSDAADEIARSSEQIDIGGRSLYLECWGERVAGEPTVLLISGHGPTTSSWELMASEFAADGHHLCAYDRAGVGGSDPAPEASRTTEDQVTDLVALLDAADLQEPVVLAAHSLGLASCRRARGSCSGAGRRRGADRPVVAARQRRPAGRIASGEARRVTGGGRGTPLPERRPLRPGAEPRAPPPGGERRGGGERCSTSPGRSSGTSRSSCSGRHLLPYLPGLPRDYHEATLAAMSDGHQEFAAESTRGTLIEVEDTGHNIQDDQPEVVMDAIRDVMAG